MNKFQVWPVVSVNETSQSSEMENSHKLQFLVGLYTDIEKLASKMENFTEIVCTKVSNLSPNVINLLNGKLVTLMMKILKEIFIDFENLCLY